MLFNSSICVCLMLIASWLARLSAFPNQDNEDKINFDGSSYITYKLSTTKRTRQDRILLLFRTIKPSGLLLHAGSKTGDFMTLELVGGKLRYSANLGSFGNTSGFHEFFLENHLADNEWHQVAITRQGKNLLIKVDVTKLATVSSGRYATLEIDDKIYVAGIDQEGESRAKSLYQRILPFSTFEGCLEDITLNRQNFATLAKKRDPNITILGNVSFGCLMTRYLPLRFFHPQSHIVISTAPYIDVLSFSFRFRTYKSDGLLAIHKDKKRRSADILLWLIKRRLKLEVTFLSTNKHVILHGQRSLNGSAWHTAAVTISGKKVTLQVDGVMLEHKLSPACRFTNSLQIVFGSNHRNIVGFLGCMHDIVVQGREVNASRETISRIRIGKCSIDDHCFINPCQNGGKCLQRISEAECDCSKTNFSGKVCQIPALPGKETCADWKAAGEAKDRLYMISPKNIKPFPVFCKLSDQKEPITIINHVLAGKSTMAVNPRTRKAGFYFHPVKYPVDHASIAALISSSTRCRQSLTYNCFNSVLFDSSHEFDLDHGRGARWVSRDGQTMDYWAGATPGSQKCACGISKTCFRRNLKCNCDTWDGVWRKDEGYITNMDALPVKNVKFSVRATSSKSNFILGGLECFGRKVVSTTRAPTKTQTSSSSSKNAKSEHKANTLANLTPTMITNTKHITDLASTYGPPIDNPPIVVIESPRKYITIRQNSNQELILIILSIILAVFILAILILLIRQNLFLPCKCIDGPIYRDVNNVDSIELGPPSSLFTNLDTEIVDYEASPYPPRGVERIVIGSSRRDSSCRVIHVNVLESDCNDENDRLHLSGGSSSSNSDDKEDWNKNKFENTKYEDIGSLETVLLRSPQEMFEVQVEKVKEALYEVISASEVNINNNPITIEYKKENTQGEEHLDNSSTISSFGMDFSRPPSYQNSERACSLEQEMESDSTHEESTRSSVSCSWNSEDILEHVNNTTDYQLNDNFRICTNTSLFSDVLSNGVDENSKSIVHSTSLSNGQVTIHPQAASTGEDFKNHPFVESKDMAESEPLLEENIPSSPSCPNGILDLNKIVNNNSCSRNNDITAQNNSSKRNNVDHSDCSSKRAFRHETSL